MQKELEKKYKIAMLAPTPFYYQIPLFVKLANSPKFNLKVYYCSDESVHGKDVKRMYKSDDKFSEKDALLKGYDYAFLKNYSPSPSFLKWPLGLINLSVWTEIKINKYDLVILQAWNNITWILAILACLKFKTPFVFMTDANVLQENGKMSIKKKIKNYLLGEYIFKKADGFLTIGSANEDFYKIYGGAKEKMIEMRYHYGYENFIKNAERLRDIRNADRTKLSINDKDFVLLFVGRLAEDKNILMLLDAYKSVNFKNKKLFLVGDGPMRKEIEKYIEDNKIDGVNILGFQSRENILKFYNIADALVLPSIIEPWGMVISEALCFGLPVIVSDKVGAGVDLVKNNENGFIFKSDNVLQLTTSIEKMIAMNAEEKTLFRKKSLENIKKWIDIDPEKQIKKIMEEIINKKTETRKGINFLKKFFYNPLFVKAARFFHLRGPLRKIYYFLFCPKNKILQVNLGELSTKFYAKTPDEMRLIESVTGDEGEKKVLLSLMSLLREEDTVYDIGANVGVYSILLGKKMGNSGKVFAFEPESESLKKIKENIKLNNLENINIIDKALGDSASFANLYISQTTGNFSLENIYEKEAKSESVEVVKGDDFVEKNNLPIPNIVKIDVEGYEYRVLRGLKKSLEKPECRIICCEIHVGILSEGVTEEKIIDFIKSLGFNKIEFFRRAFSAYHIIAIKE